ncbi:MAG: glycosyltransferase family 2 protein [Prevotella sp.]|nr:glycosyltransferase family 2 protein [Prevotella sp.]MBR1428259.1 glycosyltransferase family 2 protein [Prevotella sp.]
MNVNSTYHIGLVIVLYNPDNDDVLHINNLATHYAGCIVDNSPRATFASHSVGLMHYVFNHGNVGIAKAQNIGIRVLQKEGITHFVFIDQDSRLSLQYANDIVDEFIALVRQIPHLAALGPSVINKSTGTPYQSVIHREKAQESGFTEKDFIISSGSCISQTALHDVGLLDESLFIDFVDAEWCWRARSGGYVCGYTNKLSIQHLVGRKYVRIGPFLDIISSPFRYYYQYRNFLWLLRRRYVPFGWKVRTAVKYLIRLVYLPFTRHGILSLKHCAKGIWHGMFMNK